MNNAEKLTVGPPRHDRKPEEIAPSTNGEREALALSGTRDGVWDRDCRTNELYLSPSWKEILGYGEGDLSNGSDLFNDLLHPDDRDAALEAVRAHLEQHVPYDVDIRLRQRNGDYIWVQSKGQAIWDEGDRPIRMTGSIRDISARRRAEAELVASRQRFQEIAEIGSDWMWEVDSNLRVTWISRPENSSISLPQDIHIGTSLKELGPPDDDFLRWERHLDDMRARRPFRDFPVRRNFSDGKERHLLISANPIFATDGNFQGYRGIGRDITAQVEAEQKAASLEKRFIDAIDNMSERVALFDAEERLVHCNEAYRQGADEAAGLIHRGISFEEILRLRMELNNDLDHASEREDHWIEERLERFRNPPSTVEFQHGDRWLRACDERLADGGTIQIVTDISEIKMRVEALRESEERYRLLVELVPEPVFVECDGEIVFANKAAAAIIGVDSGDQLVGSEIASFLHPDSRLAVLKRRAEIARKGKGAEFEERQFVRLDGTEAIIESAAVPITWYGQQAILIVARDITARKQMENALRRSEANLSAAQRISGVGSWESDLNTGLNCYSEELCRILEVDPETRTLSYEDYLERVHPDDRERVNSTNMHTRKTGEPINHQYRIVQSDNTIRHVHSMAEVHREPSGKPTRVIGALQDITERVRAEEALRESEARFRALIDNSPYEIALKDVDGRFVVVNASMCAALCGREEEITGRTIHEIFPKELADKFIDHDRYILETRQAIKDVFERSTADGPRQLFVIKFPILDQDGSPVGIGFTAADVTEQKSLEERLAHAQKLEAIGKLTGGVAHEFNNLLAVILGNADLLRSHVEDDKGLIQKIMRAANRGADLTYQLLAYSRRRPLRPKITDAGSLVDGMLDMLQRTLGATVAIDAIPGRNLRKVETDSSQLEIAVLNLAVNAREAMPKGGSLPIETANVTFDENAAVLDSEALPGEYVMLAVADTGKGMTPDVLEHAVDPFFTTKDVGEGTGLGLSMAYGFAKQSGGFMEIDTKADHGTTVRMYLPRVKEQAGSQALTRRHEEPGKRSGTVLVVEDEPAVRELVTSLLSDLGHTAIAAANGDTALARFEEHPDIDILFTDIVLPQGMSGSDIARELKRRSPGLSVVFTTGYPDDEFNDLVLDEQPVRLIAKPYSRSELAAVLADALKLDAAQK